MGRRSRVQGRLAPALYSRSTPLRVVRARWQLMLVSAQVRGLNVEDCSITRVRVAASVRGVARRPVGSLREARAPTWAWRSMTTGVSANRLSATATQEPSRALSTTLALL